MRLKTLPHLPILGPLIQFIWRWDADQKYGRIRPLLRCQTIIIPAIIKGLRIRRRSCLNSLDEFPAAFQSKTEPKNPPVPLPVTTLPLTNHQ